MLYHYAGQEGETTREKRLALFHENNNNSISIKWLPRDTRKNDETYYACVTNNARWR